jgi:hypothetical protein
MARSFPTANKPIMKKTEKGTLSPSFFVFQSERWKERRGKTTRDSAYGSRVTGPYFFTIISSPNGLVYIPVNSLIEMI